MLITRCKNHRHCPHQNIRIVCVNCICSVCSEFNIDRSNWWDSFVSFDSSCTHNSLPEQICRCPNTTIIIFTNYLYLYLFLYLFMYLCRYLCQYFCLYFIYICVCICICIWICICIGIWMTCCKSNLSFSTHTTLYLYLFISVFVTGIKYVLEYVFAFLYFYLDDWLQEHIVIVIVHTHSITWQVFLCLLQPFLSSVKVILSSGPNFFFPRARAFLSSVRAWLLSHKRGCTNK